MHYLKGQISERAEISLCAPSQIWHRLGHLPCVFGCSPLVIAFLISVLCPYNCIAKNHMTRYYHEWAFFENFKNLCHQLFFIFNVFFCDNDDKDIILVFSYFVLTKDTI